MNANLFLLILTLACSSANRVAVSLLVLFPLALPAAELDSASDEPLLPQEAAASMRVPPGFRVTLFAGEPDVRQPIGFCIDDRNRLWVAEAYNYPQHGTGTGDRIVILEDTDGDGSHDKRTVFYDQLNYVTGIEVGFGGVWVMSPPYFYFIPDRNADDVPDAKPQVLLDGFGNHANAHNLANGFAWGPDGWLYGTHGRTNWSMIGTPDTPDAERIRFDGGVYRYHPVRHVWEPYADGTTNPWGIDWNDLGHAFVCNCVNPHLFQVIQGAHYEPWRGRRSSQYAYQRIATIADHLHFVGLSNVRHGLGSESEDAAGGGHAHCGTMIYLGDNFPEPYRGTLMTNNIHGRRINNDILERKGSGYSASHGPDLMRSQDPWFMGVTLSYGAGGEVYASDWSDTGECHSTRNTRKHTGRIYRLMYEADRVPIVDLTKRTNDELVAMQTHRNDWFVRHARRLLQQRAAAGEDMSVVHRRLEALLTSDASTPQRLRGLWALHVTAGLTDDILLETLNDADEAIRSWAVQLLCENGRPAAAAMARLIEMADRDDSALVRLYLASALQRFPLDGRWDLASKLVTHGEDSADPNLPLMIWYGLEPTIDADPERFANFARIAEIPLVRRHIARRGASSDHGQETIEILVGMMADDDCSPTRARDILDGLLTGLEGRKPATPASWAMAFARLRQSPSAAVRSQTVRLALAFNDPAAIEHLRNVSIDPTQPTEDRIQAINSLASRKVSGFEGLLLSLLDDDRVRSSAMQGLSNYGIPEAADHLIARYDQMSDKDQQIALQTLASRKVWGKVLMAAVVDGTIPAGDITAFTARQLRQLGDPAISRQLSEHWGEVRDSEKDRQRKIAALKKWLVPDVIASADLAAGKAVFAKNCRVCHRFFGDGGKIGPDISGSQRSNLDYMLENIVDPNASVAKDYHMDVLELIDGRVITGLVESTSDETITLQTVNAEKKVVVAIEDIEQRQRSPVSIMPSGLLDAMSETQIRDLIGYLQQAKP